MVAAVASVDTEMKLMQQLLSKCIAWVKARSHKIKLSYLLSERSGQGFYVVGRENAFDYELAKELSELNVTLIQCGLSVHTKLLPGSVNTTMPTDAIAISI